MKHFLLIALFTLSIPATLLASPPALLAPQAAAIAQKDLEDRGLQSQTFIADMRYKKASFGEKAHWDILWSNPFPAKTKGRNEIGLKVFMDGDYSRSVR